jgi:UDP-glucose 4-epimerase
MIVGDILDEKLINELVKDKFAIYHFAGIAGLDEANEDPTQAIKYNILGTANLLDTAVNCNVSRFIFASSVYVYSEHGGFYRATKQSCELLIENYYKLKKLNYSILRFGSLYGRRANNFNWIHNIIVQALTEKKMDRKGNGEEVRDYIHVTDAARACVEVLENNYKNKYLNITGTQKIKVKELLMMITEIMKNDIEIHFSDERMSGHYEITPYSFKPRIAKKMTLPTYIDLGEGILDTIYDIYKKLLDDKVEVIDIPD